MLKYCMPCVCTSCYYMIALCVLLVMCMDRLHVCDRLECAQVCIHCCKQC
jgi:hypothetical protein